MWLVMKRTTGCQEVTTHTQDSLQEDKTYGDSNKSPQLARIYVWKFRQWNGAEGRKITAAVGKPLMRNQSMLPAG